MDDELYQRLIHEEEETHKVVKYCPACNKATYKIEGCNFIECNKAEGGQSTCTVAWCWQCGKPKYRPILGKERLGFCVEVGHNSH